MEGSIKSHIPELVEKRGLTIADLTRQTGLSYQSAHALVTRNPVAIRLSTLAKLCKVLDCGVGDLLLYVPEERGQE
jgi:putative transcriptional regulator